MDDKYIFDKREMKKAFKKYGLIFLFAIPVLIGVNYFLNKAIKNIWLVVLIDVVIMFAIILIVQLIINALNNYDLNHPKQPKEKNIKTKNVVETKEFEPKVENKKNKKTTVIVKNKEEK